MPTIIPKIPESIADPHAPCLEDRTTSRLIVPKSRNSWKEEEECRLWELAQSSAKEGQVPWKDIADKLLKEFPGRSLGACRVHYQMIYVQFCTLYGTSGDSPKRKRKKEAWGPQEELLLRKHTEKHPHSQIPWKTMEKELCEDLPKRTLEACKQHYLVQHSQNVVNRHTASRQTKLVSADSSEHVATDGHEVRVTIPSCSIRLHILMILMQHSLPRSQQRCLHPHGILSKDLSAQITSKRADYQKGTQNHQLWGDDEDKRSRRKCKIQDIAWEQKFPGRTESSCRAHYASPQENPLSTQNGNLNYALYFYTSADLSIDVHEWTATDDARLIEHLHGIHRFEIPKVLWENFSSETGWSVTNFQRRYHLLKKEFFENISHTMSY